MARSAVATALSPDAETITGLSTPIDLRLTLSPLVRGSGDPTAGFDPGGAFWHATRTPAGPATLQLVRRGNQLLAHAWGAGAEAAIDGVPDLIGLHDDPSLLVPHDPVVAELVHRFPGLRLTRTNRLFEALLPAILEQKVTNTEAWRGYRRLLSRISEPAPGPMKLLLPAAAADVASLPYYAFHPFGIERRRAEVIRRAAALAPQLESAPPAEALARLRAITGIGPWTIAEVGRITFGDPDAVSIGDFHVPSLVAWVLAEERRADDARMLELLEPYRGQRGRVQRLLEVSGRRPPRHGPRLAPRRFERL